VISIRAAACESCGLDRQSKHQVAFALRNPYTPSGAKLLKEYFARLPAGKIREIVVPSLSLAGGTRSANGTAIPSSTSPYTFLPRLNEPQCRYSDARKFRKAKGVPLIGIPVVSGIVWSAAYLQEKISS
jgi:hypothetical protein